MGKHESTTYSYVLEINGRVILALTATSMQKAQKLCSDDWFFDELTRHRSSGCPIWNGTSSLTLRAARPAEQRALQGARVTEMARQEFEDTVFAFLIPLDPDLH